MFNRLKIKHFYWVVFLTFRILKGKAGLRVFFLNIRIVEFFLYKSPYFKFLLKSNKLLKLDISGNYQGLYHIYSRKPTFIPKIKPCYACSSLTKLNGYPILYSTV